MKYKSKRSCYVLMMKDSKKVVISLTKSAIADVLGVTRATIARWLKDSSVYESSLYIIWKEIDLPYIKRGYHKRPRYSTY